MRKEPLTQAQELAYGLPLLSLYFLFGPIAILQGIYATHFGLALSSIATVLFIARIFDAITDPIIGYCADLYYRKYGSRKPFIVFGGLLFIVSSWFLYVPPTDVTVEYFFCWFLAFYFAHTLFEIPHLAWGSELSTDSSGKNRIYGLRSLFVFLGTLLFFVMPLLPWFETNEITPLTLKWSVLIASSLMLPMLCICIKATPNVQIHPNKEAAANRHVKKEHRNLTLRTIFSNKPLQVLTASHICTGLGSGMSLTLLFLFVDAYLGLGQKFALLYVISFSLSIVTLRVWYKIANYWSKQVAWIAGMVLIAIGLIGAGFLSPDNTGWLSLLMCMILIYSGIAAFNIMVPSLISDIVDYGAWKFGGDQAATYFALYTFINKTMVALGGALSLAIADWYGFDPTVTLHSSATVTSLKMSVAWIPALMVLLSIIFIVRIPITRQRHAIIRRRLDSRTFRKTQAQ